MQTMAPSLLQIGLTVAGLLLAPPVIIILGKGPIVGGKGRGELASGRS